VLIHTGIGIFSGCLIMPDTTRHKMLDHAARYVMCDNTKRNHTSLYAVANASWSEDGVCPTAGMEQQNKLLLSQ
jgi:hypothetical protein